MRINRLKFKGVGPFKDEFDIDFDSLGGAALYLIDGPTGAGKTTILDCIVYALYGETSVAGTDNSRIRSDFAGINDETFIELTFTTSDGQFRIRRTPAYTRAAKRGGGTTPEDPTATLCRLDSNGVPITPFEANKVRSVNEAIPEKVGLTRSQFVQTMVLPQGQFAEFLRSDTSERLPLLRKIFGIEVFEHVLKILQERARAAKGSDELRATQLKAKLEGFNQHVALQPTELAALGKLIELRADDDLASEVQSAVKEQAELAAQAQAAHAAAVENERTAEQQHAARKAEHDAKSALNSADEAVKAAEAAESKSLDELATKPALLAEFGLARTAGLADTTWSDAKSKVDQLVGELEAVTALETKLTAWPAKLAKLDNEVAAAEAALAGLAKELADIPTELALLEGVAEGLVEAEREFTAAQAAVNALQEQLRLHDSIAELQPRVAKALAEANAAAALLSAAEQQRGDLVARRFAGMAAELARELQPGMPCQVCGSTSHPTKAESEDEPVSPAQIDAADEAARLARKKYDDTDHVYKKLGLELDKLQETVVPAEELAKQQTEVSSRLQEATAARTTAKQRFDRRAELEARKTEILTAQVGANGAVETAKATREQQVGQHTADLDRVRQALAGYPTVAERVKDLRAFGTQLAAVASAARQRQGAVATHAKAAADLQKLPQHPEFGQVEAALTALNEARKTAQELNTQHQLAANRHQSAASTGDELVDGARQRAIDYASNKTLLEVESLFSKNQDGMSLEVFVLQELFEGVVAAANRRFETLLEGRFRLVTTDQAKGGGKKGLDLNVRDLSLNEERVANTLSGGETFCASLALALGLADVVRAEHGGIAIDTLFIDEGFGSLDMDRLNDVMNMLQALQSHGRTVGVISHVEEMKNQISESIKVVAGGKGQPSSLEVSWMQ